MRQRPLRLIALALVTGLWLTSLVPVASAAPRPTTFNFTMSGAEVVPGPGDPDGTSNAAVSLFFNKPYLVCAGTAPQNVQRPYTALELHRAVAGEAGPVVAALTGGATPQSGCAEVDKALLADIWNNPQLYYLEAKNAEFPDGAIRGQLS